MSVLHTVPLVAAVLIQGVSGFLYPAFTGHVNSKNYISDLNQPVSFDKISANVGNMYNSTTRSIHIPIEGVYWITLNVEPADHNETQLKLVYSGMTTKLRTRVNGFQSSRSWVLKLRVGDRLTVMAEGKAALASFTFWSVAYIGSRTQVFSAWAGLTPMQDFDSQKRFHQNPVPFHNVITSDISGITQDDLGVFTLRFGSLYLVHLSAVGDKDLILILQRQEPHDTTWEDLLVAGAENSSRPSSVDAVFTFRQRTNLRVFRRDMVGSTPYPGQTTLLSIVSINSPANKYTAFTGETEPKGPLNFLYKLWLPVRFEKVHINTNNDYNLTTYTYTVPFDSVYIVCLRPYTRPTDLIDNNRRYIWPCCYSLTFDLKNATHTKLSASADAWTPSGISAAIYLHAGDKLQVFPLIKGYRDSNVWYGSLFSIASLDR